jgi:uracil-DNA glycosylase
MQDIVLIGEAWGEHEERQRTPFVGATGYELDRILGQVGIHRADCFLTNVFNRRPKANKIEDFCGLKIQSIPGYPALTKSRYVRAEFQPELDRLAEELVEVNPNLIVCLGNTAMWALLGLTAITKYRGTTKLSTHTVSGFKVLPTYHPAAIFRTPEIRPIVISDMLKAAREREFPDLRRPAREIWVRPTLEDVRRFFDECVPDGCILSVDIETSGRKITCIGFSPRHDLALVVPFVIPTGLGGNYWHDRRTEIEVWRIIRDALESVRIRKVFQNGLYDIAFIRRAVGVRVGGAEHDTMLLHHSLQPESLKGLGFLGSIYTDEGAWKQLAGRHTTIKAED